jgi:hypothetical protein
LRTTTYASFEDASLAEKAVGALLDNHVRAEDISVMTGRANTHFETEYGEGNTAVTTRVGDDGSHSGDVEAEAKDGISTTTAADAGAGAVKGLGWGAGLGVIAGIASLAIPGVGIVLGGGALATAIGGAVATAGAGAAAGAVTGYLKDQGMDERVAVGYERNLTNGGALVTVTNTSDNVDDLTIREILQKYGATDSNLYSAYVA